MMAVSVILVILAVSATVALAFLYYKGILTKSGNKFLTFIHDLVSFKHLYIEEILRVAYIMATVSTILYGLIAPYCMIGYYYNFGQAFLTSIVTIILGPIAVRIVYEVLMMLVMAVSHLSEIRKNTGIVAEKMYAQDNETEKKTVEAGESIEA